MKYLRLDLLTLLISLFVFTGCENDNSIGLDIEPGTELEGSLIDTATVTAVTVREDSLVTANLSQQPLGVFTDPVFGTTVSETAYSLTLPTDSSKVTFGNAPVLDSAVLVIRYGKEFYGDSVSSNYTVNVHQLAEKYPTSLLYNTKNWNYNGAVIGQRTLNRFRIKDTLRVSQIRKGKADTIVKVPPQLRIPLSASFINSNFLSASAANFSSASKMADFIKGLYVRINKSGDGGIVFTDSVRLEIYYRNTSGSRIDTNVVTFRANGASSSIKHDYSGTPVLAQLNNLNANSVFVQPLGGVRTRIRFPYLTELRKLGKISINRAELVIPAEDMPQTPYPIAPRLTFYRTDIAGQRQEVPDNDIGQISGRADSRVLDVSTFGGFYDKTKKQYTFRITSYIQSIVSGNSQQYDSYIASIPSSLVRNQTTNPSNPDPRVTDAYPSATTAAQAVLGGGTKSGAARKIKLNIIYTKLGE